MDEAFTDPVTPHPHFNPRLLEHPQPICSVLSGLHLRVALSGCIGVSSGYACFALRATLASPRSERYI